MRGATVRALTRLSRFVLFQSTLLMRGATLCPCLASQSPHRFQSTLLMRGATGGDGLTIEVKLDISIHAPHARSDAFRRRDERIPRISIHAPHARSDKHVMRDSRAGSYFNPRSSCEERLCDCPRCLYVSQFQSTLLMRGATICPLIYRQYSRFQSTLLMRGATSTHLTLRQNAIFQSTLLMRGATVGKDG